MNINVNPASGFNVVVNTNAATNVSVYPTTSTNIVNTIPVVQSVNSVPDNLITSILVPTDLKYPHTRSSHSYSGCINSGVDLSNVKNHSVILTSLLNNTNQLLPQKSRLYAIQEGQSFRRNDINLNDNRYLETMRTSPVVGGRVREYILNKATHINLSFRSYQPVNVVLIQVNPTVFPKVVSVNFPLLQVINSGFLCFVRVHMADAPTGFVLTFPDSISVSANDSNFVTNLCFFYKAAWRSLY